MPASNELTAEERKAQRRKKAREHYKKNKERCKEYQRNYRRLRFASTGPKRRKPKQQVIDLPKKASFTQADLMSLPPEKAAKLMSEIASGKVQLLRSR